MGLLLYPLGWGASQSLVQMCRNGVVCDPGVSHLRLNELMPGLAGICIFVAISVALSAWDYRVGNRFRGGTGIAANLLAIPFVFCCGLLVENTTGGFLAA